jgi:hypothetical protein
MLNVPLPPVVVNVISVPPKAHTLFAFAVIVGLGVVAMLTVALDVTALHGPAGSADVSVSVTVPAVISPALGV